MGPGPVLKRRDRTHSRDPVPSDPGPTGTHWDPLGAPLDGPEYPHWDPLGPTHPNQSTALDPYPVGGRRRPQEGQMTTTTTPPTLPDLIAALQSLHAELSAIRADLAADTAKEQNP